MTNRRGILAAFIAFCASMKAQDNNISIENSFIDRTDTMDSLILLSLDLKTFENQDPNKEFAIQLDYRGETIKVLMSDVMRELRPLNIKECKLI